VSSFGAAGTAGAAASCATATRGTLVHAS